MYLFTMKKNEKKIKNLTLFLKLKLLVETSFKEFLCGKHKRDIVDLVEIWLKGRQYYGQGTGAQSSTWKLHTEVH